MKEVQQGGASLNPANKKILLTLTDKIGQKRRPFKILTWKTEGGLKQICTDLEYLQEVNAGIFNYNHVLFDIALNGFDLSCLELSSEDDFFMRRGTITIKKFSPTEGSTYSEKYLLSDFIGLQQIKNVTRIYFNKPVRLDGTVEITIGNVSATPVNVLLYSDTSLIERRKHHPDINPYFSKDFTDVDRSYQWVVLKNTYNKKQDFYFSLASIINGDAFIEIPNKNIEIVDSPTFEISQQPNNFMIANAANSILHKIIGDPAPQVSQRIRTINDSDYAKWIYAIPDPYQFRNDIARIDYDCSQLLTYENIGKEIMTFEMLPNAEMILFFTHKEVKQEMPKQEKTKKTTAKKKISKKL